MPFSPFRSPSTDPDARVRAVEALLDEHERVLVGYATRLLGGDVERGRDAVQEAFLRLCRQEDLTELGREWLFTVTRRICIDVQRKESRMTTVEDHDAVDALGGTASLSSGEASDGASIGSDDELLHALHRLPARQQEAIRLKFESGLSYAEIARVMETSAGNVGWILHTAIQGLRSRMVPEGGVR